MRNKTIALMLLLIGLSMLVIGMVLTQEELFATYYTQMAAIG